ncbi:hypothetical protein RRG08_057333 [Elysia crispata]|uniref:Uncharacterized protein n=1 Tax=Elysia crispata TaxID=231223 RepID=A0AAE0YKA3_9GAST|nr:hypothetical protein RRG08_057333 [Elysia crispata]
MVEGAKPVPPSPLGRGSDIEGGEAPLKGPNSFEAPLVTCPRAGHAHLGSFPLKGEAHRPLDFLDLTTCPNPETTVPCPPPPETPQWLPLRNPDDRGV